MIRAIALDDEPPALKVIQTFCEASGKVELVKSFTSPHAAEEQLESLNPDLIFLDIQMPGISGIDFYLKIPKRIPVIFTTAFSEFAVEGFNLNAIDYLLKPFTYERFMQGIEKAEKVLLPEITREPVFIQIKADYMTHLVNTDEIQLIEGLDDYVRIFLDNRKTLVARLTMKNLLLMLPEKEFIRVHRSYIVPIKRIIAVKNKSLFLPNREVPVGQSFEQEFHERCKF